ncbi:MAG: bacillithiol biosynthesis deacetylase BshB2, partial [Bacilli bacterium]|nr:bacillithiol biosynthesis deacetylase BshB2 [Bacilli bacterium]
AREKELRDACTILGIDDLRLLGLRDKTLEFEDPDKLADRIGVIIAEINPSLVITHYPGHGVHPDHNALGAATIRAIGRMPQDKRPAVHCHAITKNRVEALGEADVVVDVSSVSDIKLAAIKAHSSQSSAMLARMGEQMAKDPEFRKQMEQQRSRELYWTYKW